MKQNKPLQTDVTKDLQNMEYLPPSNKINRKKYWILFTFATGMGSIGGYMSSQSSLHPVFAIMILLSGLCLGVCLNV